MNHIVPSLFLLGFCTSLLLPDRVIAQTGRYRAGRHLQAFESAWEKYGSNQTARKRTVAPLFDTFQNFLAARWAAGAKSLDRARHLLRSPRKVPDIVQWADSLHLDMESRMIDSKSDKLKGILQSFYKTEIKAPKKAMLRIHVANASGKILQPIWQKPIGAVPVAIIMPLRNIPAGDHVLRMEIVVNEKPLVRRQSLLSVVASADARLDALRRGIRERKPAQANTDSDTLQELSHVLHGLAAGASFDTDYPAARLLKQAEGLLKCVHAGKRYYGPDKTGQYLLRLKTKNGVHVARVFVPQAAKKGKPLPLVVALHGLGGSEHLFFEGYGRGKIVTLCKQRGWLLVAPRCPGLAFRFPVAEVVTEMARLYRVDKSRVFLIGHSMGAAQAVRAAAESPRLLAAVAVLGGSGRAKKKTGAAFFVGVGDRDFALEGARQLASQLRKACVKTVELREYRDVEHLVIVQQALSEVFAFFDRYAPPTHRPPSVGFSEN